MTVYMDIPDITKENFKEVFEDDLYYAKRFENKNILDDLTEHDLNRLNHYGTLCYKHGVENDDRYTYEIFKIFWNVNHLINEYLFWDFDEEIDEQLTNVKKVVDTLVDTNEEKNPVRLIERVLDLNNDFEFEVLNSGLIVMFSPHNLKQF